MNACVLVLCPIVPFEDPPVFLSIVCYSKFVCVASNVLVAGDESKTMLDAHSQAGFVVGTPFAHPGLYNFASHHSLTKEVR